MATTRRLIQAAFLILTLTAVFLLGADAERWCPFGGVEAAYSYFSSGSMICSLGASNLYMILALLVATLLLRRSFCGYVCPIGTFSQAFGWCGKKLGLKPRRAPGAVDKVMSLGKYVVLAVIMVATLRAGELAFRAADPCYALISRHGEDITFWAYVVLGAIIVGSFLVIIPFCRWFCPLAAVLNIPSALGLTRIHRHESACIDCGQCARACPTAIPVDKVKSVTQARCFACAKCIDACPKRDEKALTWGPSRSSAWPQMLIVLVTLVCIGAAVLVAVVAPLPSYFYERPGEAVPAETASVELGLEGLTCGGSALLVTFFLERDDFYHIPGYLHLQVWTQQRGYARVVVTYDPTQTNAAAVKEALSEPYYDPIDDRWRPSRFNIEGYDPLALDLDLP